MTCQSVNQKLCSHPGCTLPAAGYIPLDGEKYLCASHLDEQHLRGLFSVELNAKVCPTCDGRAWNSRIVNCERCANSGVVKVRGFMRQVCRKCNGSGIAPKMGRPKKKAKASTIE